MDIRIEDTRRDGGSLTIIIETDAPSPVREKLLAALRAALRDAGVR